MPLISNFSTSLCVSPSAVSSQSFKTLSFLHFCVDAPCIETGDIKKMVPSIELILWV